MSSQPHLNPDTPLAFVTPDEAHQIEVSRYLLVATGGMFSWDILCNLRGDYRLLTKYRITMPTIVYFISRIATFAYIITGIVHETQGLSNCNAATHATGWCFAIAVPATSLLIFWRVYAIFNSEKPILAIFTLLWLSTLATSLTVPFAISGGHIGPTDHCINTSVKPFSSASIIAFTVSDTLAFIFISWRLLQSSAVDSSFKARITAFFSGKYLPAFSRAVLQSGQEYYLITVGGNILTMGMILAPPSLPVVYHAMFTVPNIAIGNSMACRVFRYIRFGRISANVTTIRSATSTALPSLIFRDRGPPRKEFTTTFTTDLELQDTPGASGAAGIEIHQTVEEYTDTNTPLTVKFPAKTRPRSNSFY